VLAHGVPLSVGDHPGGWIDVLYRHRHDVAVTFVSVSRDPPHARPSAGAHDRRVRYRWIGFLTDYGLEDGFVAACHGVLAAGAPDARVIDITHLVPPGDVARGAAILGQTVGYLPPAVIVGVVDPGVGTARRAVALAAGDAILVGPDNGLLVPAAESLGGVAAAHALTNDAWWRRPVSATFHGRDVFCPVGARLAVGGPLADVGDAVDPASLVRLPRPTTRLDRGAVVSDVVAVDRFGNVQLAVEPPGEWSLGEPVDVVVETRHETATYAETFGAVPPGALVVLRDSAGLLAVAVNRGRAADRLAVVTGATVTVRPHDAAGPPVPPPP
jgi:S-adenosylmethionine hydrolase